MFIQFSIPAIMVLYTQARLFSTENSTLPVVIYIFISIEIQIECQTMCAKETLKENRLFQHFNSLPFCSQYIFWND